MVIRRGVRRSREGSGTGWREMAEMDRSECAGWNKMDREWRGDRGTEWTEMDGNGRRWTEMDGCDGWLD